MLPQLAFHGAQPTCASEIKNSPIRHLGGMKVDSEKESKVVMNLAKTFALLKTNIAVPILRD